MTIQSVRGQQSAGQAVACAVTDQPAKEAAK